MDINMPLMNGFEASRNICKLDPFYKPRIIAVTANENAKFSPELESSGIEEII